MIFTDDEHRNAKELAEKIISCFNGRCACSQHASNDVEQIESLIEAALNEATEGGYHQGSVSMMAELAEAKKQAYEEGFKDGHNCDKSKADIEKACYLDAAKIAETEYKKHPLPTLNMYESTELTSLRIRDAIRQKAKEIK
jgi:hypothetical protein